MRKILFLTTFLPFVAFAAPQNFAELLAIFIDILDVAIMVIISAAVLFFVWGVVQFIAKADSEEGRKEGKQLMIWGVIALFVMVSIWGLIRLLNATFFPNIWT